MGAERQQRRDRMEVLRERLEEARRRAGLAGDDELGEVVVEVCDCLHGMVGELERVRRVAGAGGSGIDLRERGPRFRGSAGPEERL